MLSHGSEGCTGYSDPLGRLYISVISHGSEGPSSEDVLSEKVQYSTDLDGSEGMDMRSAVKIWRVEKEGYFDKRTDCFNFMVWFIDFI